MRKMYILENFSSKGVRYQKGEMIDMAKAQADKFEKEGLVKDGLMMLGIEIPKSVDLKKYVTLTEHKKAQDKIKKLEEKVKELEKALIEKENTTTKKTTKKA